MKFDLQMDQDISLIPEEERNEMIALVGGKDETKKASPFANLMKGMQTGLAQKAQATKENMEFQEKLNQLKGKSEAEKVMLLKKMITE